MLPDKPPPHDAGEAFRQDIDDLKRLPDLDRSFSVDARLRFTQAADSVSARVSALTPAAFALEVSRMVALSGNAHTTVNLVQRAARFNRAPVRLAWFAEGLFVVRAAPGAEAVLGRQIVTIDGRLTEAALRAVAPYLSGTPERIRAGSPPLLESPELLHVIWPDTDGQHLILGLEDGSAVSLDALPPISDRTAAQPSRVITKLEPVTAVGRWASVLDRLPEVPIALRAPERVAFAAPLPDNGEYIRINANGNDRNGQMMDQLAAIGDTALPDGWHWAVIDLRFNDGGDELKTMAFTRRLPNLLRPDAEVYILTSNATFSAAIIVAERIRYFLGPRAKIVGDVTGDRPRFWTDGGASLVLRNSGIEIGHAYFLQDWESGCYDPRLCFPYQWIYGVAGGSLRPDDPVTWRYADYAAGRDSAMERVSALHAQQTKVTAPE